MTLVTETIRTLRDEAVAKQDTDGWALDDLIAYIGLSDEEADEFKGILVMTIIGVASGEFSMDTALAAFATLCFRLKEEKS